MALRQIFNEPQDLPYQQPLSIKVIAVEGRTATANVRCTVSDGDTYCRLTCMAEKHFGKFAEGKSLVLMNYTIFHKTLIIKEGTRVGLCKAVDVPDDVARRATDEIRPQQQPVSPAKKVQNFSRPNNNFSGRHHI